MMKHPQLSTSLFALLLAFSCNSLYAEEKHDDHKHEAHEHEEHEQHGAHEHGVASLSIAVGDEGVEIMLDSPAANTVGFEHAANSDEDKQKVADAKTKLEAGADLFTMNDAAGCEFKSAEVVSALLDDDEDHDEHEHEKEEKHAEHEHEEGEKHDEHEHEKEEKHDEHEHEKEEKHDEHEHEGEAGETHSDMDVTWVFTCAKPDEVAEVSVKLFSAFPDGFEKIKAEWVTAKGASAQELSEDTTLKLN